MQAIWRNHPDDLADAYNIRAAVFIGEQGFSTEFDRRDLTCDHLILYDGDMAVGCGRLYFEDGAYHAGRIAILKAFRGRDLGAVLMREIGEKVKAYGGGRIVLSAQCQAAGFYERQGYLCVSEAPYLDEHCPHVDMEKIV